MASTDTALLMGLADDIEDAGRLDSAIERFRAERIGLPTFAQLADPSTIPSQVLGDLAGVDRSVGDPRNLFRVHWHNPWSGSGLVDVPDHVVLPPELTGVASPILVLFGDRFPMITAHKVLAAYACLVARVVTGQFDPALHRAIWPSTGNYARGGVAISKIMGSRGVAVLPENMSAERFEWLERWVTDPADIIRTPGSESNVKEIYDACAELAKDPGNFVLNQFCEFANYLVHRNVTGPALARTFEHAFGGNGSLTGFGGKRLAAWVSATGSAGTIAAGDHLKDRYGTRIVAVEALECPTMLYNGFGEHNIQGIGDKHIPLIHNVMNTDVVVGVSDRATDELALAFGSDAGRSLLGGRGVADDVVASLEHFGFSSICNTLAAIKTAKACDYGPDDVIVTVATDGAAMYRSESQALLAGRFGGAFGSTEANQVIGRHLDAADTAHTIELDTIGRNRIFNLGYFTWVEQQGVPLEAFEARRHQSFWDGLQRYVGVWDELIGEFNRRTGCV